jgi:Ca2+/Na+ antiporter
MSSAVLAGFTINNFNPRVLNYFSTPTFRFLIFLIISASFARITERDKDDEFPVRIILVSTVVFWIFIQTLEWTINNVLLPPKQIEEEELEQ